MYLEQTGSLGQGETHRLVTNVSSEASFNRGLHHLSDLCEASLLLTPPLSAHMQAFIHVFNQDGFGSTSPGFRTNGTPDANPELCSLGQEPKFAKLRKGWLWNRESMVGVCVVQSVKRQ